jgi:hypothetical protein
MTLGEIVLPVNEPLERYVGLFKNVSQRYPVVFAEAGQTAQKRIEF